MNARTIPLAVLSSFPILWLAGCVIAIDSDTHWTHSHHDTIQGSGIAKTEARTVPDFRRIEVRGSADVTARAGEATSLSVTGDDNLLSLLTTEVRDGTLVIEMKNGSYSTHLGLKVSATAPALESVSVRGSSDVDASGLKGERFAVQIAGSGDVRASGKVDRLEAGIAGSGDLRLFELEARDARVDVSGSGDVEVWATEVLSAAIAGSGDVRYKGEPRVTQSIAGSGSVARR
jgi:hypothetical protein